ncbi:S-adenosyl-L-homocysteine hydrolase [compost metagenome]
MNNVENLSQHAPVAKSLNYLSAHRAAELVYRHVLEAHNISSSSVIGNCLVFCFSHLSTTVNLSICNHWMLIFEKLYLIPKKASLNTNLLRHVSDPTKILRSRARVEFGETIDEIKSILDCSELPVIFFDIGGYFAPYIDELSSILGDRLLLVLEDTANGHDRYKMTTYYKVSSRFKSVAYESCKMTENVMVANVMLAHVPSFVPSWSVFRPVLVVGYGRIGRSLCFGLREKGVKDIVVVDANKSRLFMASIEGFKALSVTDLSSFKGGFDYCFSMSGHHGVTDAVLSVMRNVSYIAVVTSYDDEFSDRIKTVFERGDRGSINWKGKVVNVVNKGRPINLSSCAAFDARNLSLHFLFGRIFSTFLSTLGQELSADWEEKVYSDILDHIQLR